MDVHVHIASTIFKPAGYNEANEMLVGIINFRKTLMAGFTTVRDLGADGDTIYKLKDAINKDDIIGPRIFAAGVMLNVGSVGHGKPPAPQPVSKTNRQIPIKIFITNLFLSEI